MHPSDTRDFLNRFRTDLQDYISRHTRGVIEDTVIASCAADAAVAVLRPHLREYHQTAASEYMGPYGSGVRPYE